MWKLTIFSLLLVAAFGKISSEQRKGFTYIGRSPSSLYFLSNKNDKRSVADARVGCEDAFRDGQLVAIEARAEHQEVRRWLSTWGILENDRVWTTGQYHERKWVWYDYYSGDFTPIKNACDQPDWLNNECPTNGCLAIGGRDLTYKWQSDNCTAKRRYLCEYPDPDEIEHLIPRI